MKVTTLIVGPLFTNCYIVSSGTEAAIIDPGGDAGRIIRAVETGGFDVDTILLTHGHYDHVEALEKVQGRFKDAKLLYHKGDFDIREDIVAETALFGFEGILIPKADRFLEHGSKVTLGKEWLEVLHTPGHTPGSITFLDRDGGRAIVGDTLFAQGIGRTDLAGGDSALLIRTIKERLYTLDKGTEVLPGHGPATTVGNEKRFNMWVRG
jgi:hydroxyacylglutathione hydrolase